MERLKFLEKIRFWEHPPLSGATQTEEKNKIIFKENQAGHHQHPVKSHRRMMVNQETISGPFQGITLTVITLKRESNCTCREKNHSQFHYDTLTWPEQQSTTLDVMLERRIDDYWNIEGAQHLSDLWTGFTRFTTLDEKPPDGYTWSGERFTKKQTTSRPHYLWREMWKDMSEAAQRKEKQNGLSRNWSLTMPEDCAVFTSLIQRMRVQRNYSKCAKKVGSSDASNNALQDQGRKV